MNRLLAILHRFRTSSHQFAAQAMFHKPVPAASATRGGGGPSCLASSTFVYSKLTSRQQERKRGPRGRRKPVLYRLQPPAPGCCRRLACRLACRSLAAAATLRGVVLRGRGLVCVAGGRKAVPALVRDALEPVLLPAPRQQAAVHVWMDGGWV